VSCSYYIYYRIDPAQSKTAGVRIRQLLGAVRSTTGIPGRLMKKHGEPALWMEVYENVSDSAQFEWELADAAARLRVLDFVLPGTQRHVECFECA